MSRSLLPTPLVVAAALVMTGCSALDGAPPIAAQAPAQNSFDASQLLVLSDADMAATAYADGALHPISGQTDNLTILTNPGRDAPRVQHVPAGNTVMGWPGATAVSPDGRYAFVIEGNGPAPEGREIVEDVFHDFPASPRLVQIRLEDGMQVAARDVCPRPKSIDMAPSGGWLLVACAADDAELAVVSVQGETLGSPRVFDLAVPALAQRARDAGATYAVIRPDGRAAAAILANLGVVLVTLEGDGSAAPTKATAGGTTVGGSWLTVARWARDGQHLIVADVAWGPAPTDAVFNGDGSVLSFRMATDTAPRLVSAAQVSKSPEAIEIDRTGTLLVAVNMERTYLPGGFLRLIRGRNASSLSLVAFDPASGMLTTLGEPVGFRGVLPEDAVFDRDGDSVAVVIYQDHDAPRSQGWVQFFEVRDRPDGPRLVPTDRRIPMPRGAHDLAVID